MGASFVRMSYPKSWGCLNVSLEELAEIHGFEKQKNYCHYNNNNFTAYILSPSTENFYHKCRLLESECKIFVKECKQQTSAPLKVKRKGCDLVGWWYESYTVLRDVLNLCEQKKTLSRKVSHCFDMFLPHGRYDWQEGSNTTAQSHFVHKLHNNTCFCSTVHFELMDLGLSSVLLLRARWSYKVLPTLPNSSEGNHKMPLIIM